MKSYAFVLFAAASMFGLSACNKQQEVTEAPAPVQAEAQPATPTDVNVSTPAETAPVDAAPAAAAGSTK
jgi:hypothetical protein